MLCHSIGIDSPVKLMPPVNPEQIHGMMAASSSQADEQNRTKVVDYSDVRSSYSTE
jgi:hypothetical protein